MPDDALPTPPPNDDATDAATAPVEPYSAPRVRVRVDADGTAQVGRKRVQFGRSLAGALVTVEERR